MKLLKYGARRDLLIITLLILPFLAVTAQNGIYNYDVVTLKDGLSQSTVNTILQDRYGFMWFGTANGLDRFDGYDFIHYLPEVTDSSSISNNIIHSIIEDKEGYLWVATEFGLNRYDQKSGEFKHFIHFKNDTTSIGSNFINTIFQDSDNNIWVGNSGAGLDLYNRKTNSFRHFHNNLSERSNIIYSIIEDNKHKNILWIGTEHGLFEFDRNKEKFLTSAIDSSDNPHKTDNIYSIRAMLQDSTGELFIGTWNGLINYSPDKGYWEWFSSVNTTSDKFHRLIVLSLLLDDNNTLWAGTRDNGLISVPLNENRDTVNEHPQLYNEFKDETIVSLYKDLSGMMWVGTRYHGINKLARNNKKFRIYNAGSFNGNGLSSNIVLSVTTDRQKNLWVGTRSGGLNKIELQHSNVIQYRAKPGSTQWLNNDNILSLASSYSENTEFLWIGTDGGGLNKLSLSNNTFEVYSFNPKDTSGISNNYIHALSTYDENHLMIGYWLVYNYGILDILNLKTNKITHFKMTGNNNNGLVNNAILKIYKDRSGIVWLGTKGAGLAKIEIKDIDAENPSDIGTVTNYTHDLNDPGSISHNDVFAIYESRNGILWIGTGGGGLERFDRLNETFHHYTKEDGLPDDIIYGIEEDENDNLWLSTDNGLCWFNPRTEKFITYDKRDGQQNIIFNRGAYSKASDGQLFFGGVNGLTAFYADSIKSETYAPKIVITKFDVSSHDKKYDYRHFSKNVLSSLGKINLPHQYKNLSFEFAALDYSNSYKNKYSYILEGYDSKWISTDASRRFANYTNLSPGKYIFKVKGTNSDGVWSNQIATVEVSIKAPFWLRWWFITITILLLLFLAVLYIIQWFKKQLKVKEQLEEWAESSVSSERNQLRTLIDNLPDSIYIKDRESRFIIANKKVAEVMKAKSPADLIGKQDFDFYPYDLALEYYNDEQEIMRSDKPLIGKAEPGQDEHGNSRIISTTKVPIKNKNGETVGIIGMGRDITTIKNAERELRNNSEMLQETNALLEERQEEIQQQSEELQAQAENLMKANSELERLNRTKDKFFSIIAHDLKNPFHAIIGFSEMLVNDFRDMDDQQKLGLIELINMSSESAFNLLENLLQWARTQTDKIKFVPKKIDISKIVLSVFKLHKISAEKKRIRLENHVQDFKYVFADENMINTVIRNLISNAIKFTNSNGTIDITTSEVNGDIEISIADNGVGISEDNIEKLFRIDSYYSTSGTSGEAGTGLGLIICQEFVKKNGGKLRVDSIPGKGSTFTFNLPKVD